MRHAVFSILVENSSGVLSRVAGLFSRRGYNIDSLTVGETQDPKYSRMTVTVTGDDDVLEQIQKQLTKLVDVKEIIAISDVFRAKIVDVSPESVIIELTGAQNKLNAFIELLNGFKITELARTGITGLARGAANLK